MNNAIIQTGAVMPAATMQEAGQVANVYAARQVFADYQLRKSSNTLRAQYADLATFARYLCATTIANCPSADELQNAPEAWQGMTWGLVQEFAIWMLKTGLALTSVNRKLSTVKVYAGLAAKAKVITGGDLALIQTVKGYAAREFKQVDEKRTMTRQGAKKVKGAVIDDTQAKALKAQPNTHQGRRDAVIVCLLVDQGLRVGELALLQVTDVDLRAGQLRFYRPKVGKTQTHKLTQASGRALRAYMASDATALGPLLRGSRRGGALEGAGMTERSITVRVGELGERLGIDNLSAHDLRHFWATRAIRKGADPFQVLQAGGWTSMQTVKKYIEETAIANQGIGDDEEPAT